MKKLLFACVIATALVGAAFAQDDNVDWNLTAGAQVGYSPNFFTETNNSVKYSTMFNNLDIGAFIDLPFVRLTGAYGLFLSASPDAATGPLVSNFQRTYIDLNLLGKYPFMMGDFSIWPAIGVGYQILTFIQNDADAENDTDVFNAWNDLYVVGGVGADFKITENFVLTPSILFGYNLMPNPTDAALAAGNSFNQYKLNVNLGFGYSF